MTLLTQQSAKVIPFFPDQQVPEDDLDRAAQSVHIAVADFTILLRQARTSDRCLQIRQQIGQLVSCLQAVEDAALDRAEAV